MPDLPGWELGLRLLLAAGLGGAIGLERELRERQAGFRTHVLVAVGAALFTLVSAYGWRDFHPSRASGITFDPSRVAAQVVTGIGFLGAGAIIRQGLSVRGLTTAASLWAAAAIGLAAGAGSYTAAAVATVLVLVTLWPLRIAAHRFFSRFRSEEATLIVDLEPGQATTPLLAELERGGGRIQAFELEDDAQRRRISLQLDVGEGSPEATVARLAGLEHVLGARWTQ